MQHIFHTQLPEWVYFQAHMHHSLEDKLVHLLAIQTFCNKLIVEPVCTNNTHLFEMEAESAYYFNVGDWVTLQIGVYEGELGCVIGMTHYPDITIPVGSYAELLPLSPKAITSKKVTIQDGFQLLELSNKTLLHAENLDWNDLKKFMWPPSLVKWPDDAMPIQDIMDNSLWKFPMPKHYCGDQNRRGNYVELFAGEHKSQPGFMQGVHDPVLISYKVQQAKESVWLTLSLNSKKCPLDLMVVTLHANTVQGDNTKGKLGLFWM
ncbi:hypothetical protein EDD18DRAFT_1112506 [Armillaria luteobubalina]|uniref:Uncharacterized protein n=1 Tax=Armillaria luteobubalina TaxID=153913 RepID=A0AA39PEP9_9AGAR|nr:hypothetical protein EDD18DRAFT_1112506 [Armillaria luteobubalina]